MLPKKFLYPILDTEHCEKFTVDPTLLLKVWESFSDFVPFFQLRSKNLNDLEFKNLYLELNKKSKLPIIINDRLGLALSLRSFGIHLGKEDYENLSKKDRIHVRDSFPIRGTSSHSLEDLHNLEGFWDYTGIGPIFPTNSKKSEYPTLGLAFLEAHSFHFSIPLVAIGGIQKEHISKLAGIPNVVPASIGMFSTMDSFPEIVSIWKENIA